MLNPKRYDPIGPEWPTLLSDEIKAQMSSDMDKRSQHWKHLRELRWSQLPHGVWYEWAPYGVLFVWSAAFILSVWLRVAQV